MNDDAAKPPLTDIAFSASVKAMQERLGSRDMMRRLETRGKWRSVITEDLARFIAMQTSIFLGTASADGQPYVQHRGGKPGFLAVLDDRHLSIPDYSGNRQYISLGNLSENSRAFIFLIDYERQTRIKLWGRASIVDVDGPGRAIQFELEAWDVNCRQYLPEMYPRATVEGTVKKLLERIEELESQMRVREGQNSEPK